MILDFDWRDDGPWLLVAARRRAMGLLEIDCPYCGHIHRHGIADLTEADDIAHRAGHCGLGDGYFVKLFPHEPRSRQGRKPQHTQLGDRLRSGRGILFRTKDGGDLRQGCVYGDATSDRVRIEEFSWLTGKPNGRVTYRPDSIEHVTFHHSEDFRQAADLFMGHEKVRARQKFERNEPSVPQPGWREAVNQAAEYGRVAANPQQHQPQVTSMREYVKLYRDGDGYALSTNIMDERVFIERAATALIDGVTSKRPANHFDSADVAAAQRDPEHELAQWLPQVIDIVCKLRGYKAPLVEEQRVLTAGRIAPTESSVVAASETGTQVVGRIEPEVASA